MKNISPTYIHGFALDSCSPAATISAPWYLKELRHDNDIVLGVLDDLNASFSGIVLRPRVAIQTVTLITGMSGL